MHQLGFVGGRLRHVMGVVVVAGTLAGSVALQSQSAGSVRTQIPGRDLALDPPIVQSTSIELPATDKAGEPVVVRMRFAESERLPSRLDYLDGDVRRTLSDDGTGGDNVAGDRTYAVRGPLDVAELRKALEPMARSTTALPMRTFRDRSKVIDRKAQLNLGGLVKGGRFPWEPWGDPATIDAERSLTVREPAVVQDATRTRASCGQASMGPWSFGYLMEQLANTPVTGVTGPQLARSWVDSWKVSQSVNGWTLGAGPSIQQLLIGPWETASGGPNMPLDLSIAPFRLLAIVNRVDLRSQAAYGGGDAGELRFVFTAMGGNCAPLTVFNVIFEFGVPARGCLGAKWWAQQWKDLDHHVIGSPAYNAALETLTAQVVVANRVPGKPNGSALNQLRTNGVAFPTTIDPDAWDLREYKLNPVTHILALAPVAQTPANTRNGSSDLAGYVTTFATKIKNGRYTVPLTWPFAQPFRGGSSLADIGFSWDAPGIGDRQARHQFSLGTCNACHTAETGSVFTHVAPAGFGATVSLSGFLTGTSVADPRDGLPVRQFNDLERRATDLSALLATPCLVGPAGSFLGMAH